MSNIDAVTSPAPTAEPPKRWASLADRLNPNRPAFDPRLKESWKTMGKAARKRMVSEDRRAIRALKARGAAAPLPFPADPDDHCETSPAAYSHVAPLLTFVAERLGKRPRDLAIYDPYYCAGATVRHLNGLGFRSVYNKREDFYDAIARKRVPSHDVLVTNPPYSGDHFDRLLKFLSQNDKPALLLLPDHFSDGKSPRYSPEEFCFLTPPERYHYWTPEGMRPERDEDKSKRKHRNLFLGSRNSPFASHWFIRMDPLMTNASFVSLVKRGEIKLAEGCRVHSRQEDIPPMNFKGSLQNNDVSESAEDSGRRKRRRRNRKKRQSE